MWEKIYTYGKRLACDIERKDTDIGNEQFKEEDEEADRGNDGKTTSKSGLALNGKSCYGKLRTARSGGS